MINIATTHARKIWASLVSLSFVFLLPLFTFAQTEVDDAELAGYTDSVIDFFNEVLIPLILAIAFLVFIWGVFKFFIFGAQDEGARENGKNLMIWGILGFVIIISIVGIVSLLGDATGLNDGGEINTPKIPGVNN